LLSAPNRPDAIFSINDVMAFSVINAAHLHGLRVPEDVLVVGFDDIQMAKWDAYQLRSMVASCLELLAERMWAPTLPGEQLYTQGELLMRGSTRLQQHLMKSTTSD